MMYVGIDRDTVMMYVGIDRDAVMMYVGIDRDTVMMYVGIDRDTVMMYIGIDRDTVIMYVGIDRDTVMMYVGIDRDTVMMYVGINAKYPLFLSQFNEIRNLRDLFSKNCPLPSFMKIRAVAGKSFHADGQTDSGKLVVAFRNLADAPKYSISILQKTHYKEQLVGAAGVGEGGNRCLI